MNPQPLKEWGSIATSIAVMLIFAGMAIVAIMAKDPQLQRDLLIVLLTTAVTGFRTIVDFWCGSSNSSQKKDDVIAASVPPSRQPPVEP